MIIKCSACVSDHQQKVITIKNNYEKNIVIIYSEDSIISDSDLFYNSKYSIKKKETVTIKSLGVPVDNFFLYVFNEDSVYDNIKEGNKIGIYNKSILAKYFLSKIKIANDTFNFSNR